MRKFDVISVCANFITGESIDSRGWKIVERFVLDSGRRASSCETPPPPMPSDAEHNKFLDKLVDDAIEGGN